MPNWVCRIGGSLDPVAQLTQAEQDNNIMCIYGELKGNYGWSDEAIAGACGCFHEESGFNPGIYETSRGGNLNNLPYFPGGMGLAQWTDYPAYEATHPNPLPWDADLDNKDWWDGSFQCFLLTQATTMRYLEVDTPGNPRWGWLTDTSYPSISFNDYINNTHNMSISDAVTYWFFDLEWHDDSIPSWVDFNARVRWGQYCYDLFHGLTPDPPGPGPGPGPGPTPGKSKKMPLWMYLKRIPF